MNTEQPLRLTLLWEPSRLDPTPLSSGPESLGTFLEDIAAHTGVPVKVERHFLKDYAEEADFVLLAASIAPALALTECTRQRQAELAAKLVPLNVSKTGIFELLEKFSLPAAITGLALAEWEASRMDGPGASGLYGQREIGQAAGAACVRLFTSARYCYLESTTHEGLPHLLADYLRAWASFAPAPTQKTL